MGSAASSSASLLGQGKKTSRQPGRGRVYYTLDNYPFVERTPDGRLATSAAPPNHGNALAPRAGELVGGLAADAVLDPSTDQSRKQHKEHLRQLKPLAGSASASAMNKTGNHQ